MQAMPSNKAKLSRETNGISQWNRGKQGSGQSQRKVPVVWRGVQAEMGSRHGFGHGFI
jgi:hypothetical protein